MTTANPDPAPRRRSSWLTRVLVVVALVLLASVPPVLDPTSADPSPSALNPVYDWAASTHLFW